MWKKKLQILTHLRDARTNPNGIENRICENTLKHIPLSMNFTRIEFIEQGHHYEWIENYGEVLSWRLSVTRFNV